MAYPPSSAPCRDALTGDPLAGWHLLAQIIHTIAANPTPDPAYLLAHALVPDLASAVAVLHPDQQTLLAFVCAESADQVALEGMLRDAAPPVLLLPLHARGRVMGSLRMILHAEIDPNLSMALADILALALIDRAEPPAPSYDHMLESRSAFEAIYQQAGIGIAFGDHRWRVFAANRAFQELTGYSEAELCTMAVADLTPPDEMAREVLLAQELITGRRQHYVIEKHYRHKAGHLVPVRLTGIMIAATTDTPLQAIVLVEDLTARRQAEVALRSSEARYRMLIEQQTELVVCWRLSDGVRTFVNDAYCRFFGRSYADLIGKPIYDAVHPADQERIREELSHMIGLQGRRTGINRVIAANGEIAWYEWSTQLISGSTAEPDEVQSVGRDVTARHQAEEVRDWLAAILEASPAVVSIVDLEGRLGYLNRAARHLHSLADDVDLAAIDVTRLQPEWALQQAHELAVPITLRDGIWHGETGFLNQFGGTVPYWQTMLALRDAEGRVARLASIAYDLSEQRRAAAHQLALERKMLEAQKLESLGVLAGGVAHDFNNILAVIVGHAELAMYSGDVSQEAQQSLEAVVENAQRAADLTRQILAYAGKGRVIVRQTNMSALVHEVATGLAGSALRHCVLDLDLLPDAPPIEADQSQMRQLIVNLLLNAAEAVADGGAVSVRVALVAGEHIPPEAFHPAADLRSGRYLELTVRDNGIGIMPEVQARIFDPFFSTKFVGRGMGLAAVQGIVRAHRGAIELQSSPGQGTQFQIWLPIDPAEPPSRAAESP